MAQFRNGLCNSKLREMGVTMGISFFALCLFIGSIIVAVRTSQIFRDFILSGRKNTPNILSELKGLGIRTIGAEFILFLVLGADNFFELSLFVTAIALQIYLLLRLQLKFRNQNFELHQFFLFTGKILFGLFVVHTIYQITHNFSNAIYALLYSGSGIVVLPLFKSLTAILFLYVFLELLLPLYIRLFLGPSSIPSIEIGNFLNECFQRVELSPIEIRIVDFGGIRALDIFVVGMRLPGLFRPIVLINKDLFSVLSAEEFQALLLQKVSRYDQSLFIKRFGFSLLSLVLTGVFANWIKIILKAMAVKKYAFLALPAANLVGGIFLALLIARWLRLQQLQADVFTVIGYGVSIDHLISGMGRLDQLRGPAMGTYFSPDIPTAERAELIYKRIYVHQSGKKTFQWNDFLRDLGVGKIGTALTAALILLFIVSGITKNYFMKEVRSLKTITSGKSIASRKSLARQKSTKNRKVASRFR